MPKYIDSGNLSYQPNFSISVEGKDITDEVRDNLISVSLTDEGASSKKSDQISVAIVSENLKIPAKGVKVSLGLGFGQDIVDKGVYIVDSNASGGSGSSPRIVQFTAKAFSKSNDRGHGTVQSQKTRSWSGITLGDMVNTIASEQGLTPRVSPSLSVIQITHEDQIGESDMNLLTRIAAKHNAVSKISHDYWIFAERNSDTTISGQSIKSITITKDMVSRWAFHNNSDTPNGSQSGSGTFEIPYHDVNDGGQIKILTAGSGEPTSRIEFVQPNLQEAQEIVAGFAGGSTKKLKGMSLEMDALPELLGLTAQCIINTKGFGSVEDGKWHISKLEMSLSEQGFSIKIELE